MKKAAAALVLLVMLAGASVWNIRYLDALTDRIEKQVELSRSLWADGDARAAAEALDGALDIWFGAEGYTHVFIRHAEVNDVTDAFFDVYAALTAEDASSAGSQYDRLRAHLESIDSMEHVTLKSVF